MFPQFSHRFIILLFGQIYVCVFWTSENGAESFYDLPGSAAAAAAAAVVTVVATCPNTL